MISVPAVTTSIKSHKTTMTFLLYETFCCSELCNVGVFMNSRASLSNVQEFLLLRVFHSNQKPGETILPILFILPIGTLPSADGLTIISCGFHLGFLTGSCFGVYSGLFRICAGTSGSPESNKTAGLNVLH